VCAGGYWQGDDYFITLQGQVRETRVFGENLLLKRTLTMRLGEPAVRVADTVVNEGFQPAEHMLLYHINAGFPLAAEGARLQAPSSKIEPRDEEARQGAQSYAVFDPPSPGYREQVFYHTMQADPQGYVRVTLHSPARQDGQALALYLRYRQAELPCFVEWKMMGQGVYAVGLEPSTNLVSGRSQERQRGALITLQPGEERQYELEIGIER
jgi:hypothetical protein